ncbi:MULTISPECIES: Fur family transcriptional regulator [unclassified Dysgonomonas]|uniref:Fur family transcriptional regulator n=1 Tax=unclassified Dysgonomonas TaxID=2630389 RepID=UPI0013EDCC3C|nr:MULTISPECIES: transcriptional repressor [unclassified Dysgonomonas]
MDNYIERLQERGINITAVRLLIFKEMMNFSHAFCLADLETTLDTVDKSTLFRTITLFHEKRLIHSIDDGSGSIKYSVCSRYCDCSVEQQHTHFYCEKCKTTFCLDNASIPEVNIPQNFILHSANFVLKGLCSHCSKIAT